MTDDQPSRTALGANEWLVDEMFEQFRSDPSSVSASWQEFFADYAPRTGTATGANGSDGAAGTTAAPAGTGAAPAAAPAPAPSSGGKGPTDEGDPSGD
ncbi:MAG: hypothetical protein AAGK32_13825, partial [Actinomycetota bacterium]